MCVFIQALNASLAKQCFHDRPGCRSRSTKEIGIIKHLSRFLSSHAECFLQQQSRLKQIGLLVLTVSGNESIRVSQQIKGTVPFLQLWNRSHNFIPVYESFFGCCQYTVLYSMTFNCLSLSLEPSGRTLCNQPQVQISSALWIIFLPDRVFSFERSFPSVADFNSRNSRTFRIGSSRNFPVLSKLISRPRIKGDNLSQETRTIFTFPSFRSTFIPTSRG